MPGSLPILFAQSSSVPLQWLDVVILAASVIGVTVFGMWIGRKEESTGDYYLAGKTVAWWAVAGSIFGTNISSHHMVGMMGAGLKEGFAQACVGACSSWNAFYQLWHAAADSHRLRS